MIRPGRNRRIQVRRNTLPTPPIAGLTLWLRGDMGITLGTGVAGWADQSGSGNHTTQATPARQPTFVASDANLGGQPSIRFNVANNALDMANSPTFAWVAVVATYPAATFGGFAVALSRGGAADFLIGSDTTADWATGGSAVAGTRYRDGSATNVALTTANAPHFYEFEPTVPVAGALRVGGRVAPLEWDGTIAEVFGMATVPDGIIKTALRAYISARYGFVA